MLWRSWTFDTKITEISKWVFIFLNRYWQNQENHWLLCLIKSSSVRFLQTFVRLSWGSSSIPNRTTVSRDRLTRPVCVALTSTPVFCLQLSGSMSALCSRPDFLGRLGRHYLTDPDAAGRLRQSPMSLRALERRRQPRLSLRPLASYRTLLLLLAVYMLGALLSLGPLSTTALLLAGGFLFGVLMTLCGDKLKTHWTLFWSVKRKQLLVVQHIWILESILATHAAPCWRSAAPESSDFVSQQIKFLFSSNQQRQPETCKCTEGRENTINRLHSFVFCFKRIASLSVKSISSFWCFWMFSNESLRIAWIYDVSNNWIFKGGCSLWWSWVLYINTFWLTHPNDRSQSRTYGGIFVTPRYEQVSFDLKKILNCKWILSFKN